MILSDTSLGALLASLNFVTSLSTPLPAVGQELAANPFINNLDQVAKVSGIDARASSNRVPLVAGEQDSIAGLAASEPRTNARTSLVSRSSPDRSSFTSSSTTFPGDSKAKGLKGPDVSCTVEAYNSPIVTAPAFGPFDKVQADIYRYRKQQSVNFGSWFVHEKWMTPSLFKCASGKQLSEIDIAFGYGSIASARAVLERHWDTFITAADFAYLASIGINTVRLPIGYWNLGPSYCKQTPFEPVADVYRTAWAHVVHAINMAADVGIGVLVDLHGAVGSQNGQDHSGISDGKTNLFTNSADQNKTIAVLTFLTEQLSIATNVVGIQLLNEPKDVPQLTDFYTHALDTLRQISPEAAVMALYIHDGFNLERIHNFVSARKDFVVQDHHSYFVFTDKDTAESPDDHTRDINGTAKSLAENSRRQRDNLVIDEFSCALSPESLAKVKDPESARKRFCEVQVQVYQKATAGWSFWSYTKEGCEGDGGWCFKYAVGKYLPSTFFSYPRDPFDAELFWTGVASGLTEMHLPNVSYILQLFSSHEEPEGPLPEGGFKAPPNTTRNRNPRALPRKMPGRFATIRSRRQSVGQPTYFSPISLASRQNAAVLGYGDGFITAKIFASYGLSRLGFVGQYIEDHIEDRMRSLGTAVEPIHEAYYREWFRIGLEHGESKVGVIALTAGIA